ncbi:polymorphic toxin-type HINT domain-containing protein, partial [Streptomyces sp. NPDC003393]
TPTSQNCADPRSATSLAGPAPYWTSYTYNNAGQRLTETQHKSTGDTKSTYCYTKPTQPHTLTGTTTKTDCTAPERAYAYDTTGNTTTRPGTSGGQSLTWSPEGKLSKLTEAGTSTNYIYGAEGSLLIRAKDNGERILYAGATELHLRANGTTWAQRYYSAGGITAAFRSNESGANKLTYLTGDHHGTSSLALTPDTAQTFTKRYTTPFGEDRGKPQYGPWPDDKGFLGKTRDTNTGLTHIGAREYDPTIGQFLSVDPILDTANPQSLNGYSYAANNPVTDSDPDGRMIFPGQNSPGLDSGGGKGSQAISSGRFDGDGCNGCASGNSGSYGNGTALGGNSGGTHDAITPAEQYRCGFLGCEPVDNPVQFCQHNEIFCKIVSYGPTLEKVSKQAWEIEKDLLGIGGFEDCMHGDINACMEISKDALIQSKLKVLGRVLDAVTGTPATGKLLKFNCKCFLAGTDVLMADRTTKNIEDVKPGDKVLATDPKTGKTAAKKVTRLIVTDGDKYFNKLSIATEGGIQQLTATHEHPFWSPSAHDWVAAGALTPGMSLLTDDGTTVTVTANHPFTKHARTYNLTVDDLHTYYVLAGQTPVLVHNSSLCGTAALEDGDWKHILDRHRPGGALVDEEAGLFIGKEKKVRQRIIDTINRGTPKPNTPDPVTGAPRPGQIYEWDFGDTIGKAGPANGGGNLTRVRVIVNDGKVVTAFPF